MNNNENMIRNVRAYIETIHRLLKYNDMTVIGLDGTYLINYYYKSGILDETYRYYGC